MAGGRTGPLPTMVEYIGYGGGRGQPYEWLLWASAGYAHLVMDTRGQGGTWQGGDTSDIDDERHRVAGARASCRAASSTPRPTTTGA